MGAYVSKTPAGQVKMDVDEEEYATAEVHTGQPQKEVTFANPPASDAKPRARDKPSKAAQPVLKRKGGKPRANRTSGAAATPSSASKRKSTIPKGKRSPRARPAAPSPATPAAATPATPAAAAATAATPNATPKPRGRPAGAAKRAKAAAVRTAAQTAAAAKSAAAAVSATVANAAHELVVIGKSVPQVAQSAAHAAQAAAQSAAQSAVRTVRRQRNALPARKVNMKRVSKRQLQPVGQKGGRGRKA